MEITTKSLTAQIPITASQTTRIVKTILKAFRIRKGFLSFVFVNSSKIKQLNAKYLKRGHVTDVLAFDLASESRPGSLEGEVFICVPQARKNAKIFKNTPRDEIILYIIHGVLHLLGYDDHSAKDIARMRKKEQSILKILKKNKIIE